MQFISLLLSLLLLLQVDLEQRVKTLSLPCMAEELLAQRHQFLFGASQVYSIYPDLLHTMYCSTCEHNSHVLSNQLSQLSFDHNVHQRPVLDSQCNYYTKPIPDTCFVQETNLLNHIF